VLSNCAGESSWRIGLFIVPGKCAVSGKPQMNPWLLVDPKRKGGSNYPVLIQRSGGVNITIAALTKA